MAVLNALAYESKGRTALAADLNRPDLNLSGHDIRTALAYLTGKELVVAGRGRRGSSITEKGMEFLAAQTGENRLKTRKHPFIQSPPSAHLR